MTTINSTTRTESSEGKSMSEQDREAFEEWYERYDFLKGLSKVHIEQAWQAALSYEREKLQNMVVMEKDWEIVIPNKYNKNTGGKRAREALKKIKGWL